MQRKSGFTLLELIVVIIIIGILATFGFAQYTTMMEKGRAAEAKSNLGTLRKLELAYYQEYGSYAVNVNTDGLAAGLPQTSCTGDFYFNYICSTGGSCSAMRCTSGGKLPPGPAKTFTLYPNGTFTES